MKANDQFATLSPEDIGTEAITKRLAWEDERIAKLKAAVGKDKHK